MGAIVLFIAFMALLNLCIIAEAVHIYVRENFIKHNTITFWEVLSRI